MPKVDIIIFLTGGVINSIHVFDSNKDKLKILNEINRIADTDFKSIDEFKHYQENDMLDDDIIWITDEEVNN